MLVGIDGSEDVEAVLLAAVGVLPAGVTRLVVVYVAEVPHHLAAHSAAATLAFETAVEDAVDRCRLYCEMFLARATPTWSFEVRRGSRVFQLLRAASDHEATCIVVGRGTCRRRRARRSIVDRLVSQADRPVVLVPGQVRGVGRLPAWRT